MTSGQNFTEHALHGMALWEACFRNHTVVHGLSGETLWEACGAYGIGPTRLALFSIHRRPRMKILEARSLLYAGFREQRLFMLSLCFSVLGTE